MFKVILPIVLIATTIITYISIDYFKNKKDNNISSTGNSDDGNNQLTNESSVSEIIEDNLSYSITSQGDDSSIISTEEDTYIKVKDQEVTDVEEQSTNEFYSVPTLLEVQDSIKKEEIKVKEQFIILSNEEDVHVCGGVSTEIDIFNTINDEILFNGPSFKEKEHQDIKLITVCDSFDQCGGASAKEESNELKTFEDHVSAVPFHKFGSAQLLEEQLIGSTDEEKQSDTIPVDEEEEEQNEIDASIVIKSIESSINNNNTSTKTTTATYPTTSSTSINQQIQPLKEEHNKCYVTEVKKDLIKFYFVYQCGCKQQQQQYDYESKHLKMIPSKYRNEILVAGYPNYINEITLSRFFCGCEYDKFICGPDVSYIKFSNSNSYERAVSLNGNEISNGNPITVISYEGGLGINQSSIVCNYYENNNCKFNYGCNYLHGNQLPTKDGLIPQIYQQCLHSNHIKWWRTMPLLNLEEFAGKRFRHCKKCHKEDQYQNSRYNNTTTKFNKSNKKSS